ncbi:MAG TPA: SufS family cysteine desulfurase, partial [Polyangiaceae bacterium]
MNTSNEETSLAAPGSGEPVGAGELGRFAGELERLANQFFSGVPSGGGAAPPLAHPGPSALAVGAGGASPAVSAPPVPGMFQQQPPASSPLPTDRQLQAFAFQGTQIPGDFAPGAFPLVNRSTPAPAPYFLDLAGPPAAPEPRALPTSTLDASELSPELTPAPSSSRGILDPHAIKRDFPILEERVHGKKLVWLDNAATTQKPRAVIERLSYYYEHENSNIHRGAHALAARATDAYEAARDKVRRFLNAPSSKEIVFVRGGTEAINLVAQSWGRRNVAAGDEIVVSLLEHHANIVPWQQLAKEKGARLRAAPVDDDGQILLEDFERLLGPKTRIVAITHVSNALGTIVPVREMTAIAHRYGARVLVDGAQSVSHMPVDVQAIDCDFYCFSGHKVFAPTGIGALFGKAEVLDAMPPWQGGGNMISDVTFQKTTYQAAPWRFEAGTGNIGDAVGLGAALDYVTAVGMPAIERYEHELLVYATERLETVPGLRMIGTAREKAGVLSFVLDGQRTEDVGGALDREGIAVRSGHHCAQPILRRFGL